MSWCHGVRTTQPSRPHERIEEEAARLTILFKFSVERPRICDVDLDLLAQVLEPRLIEHPPEKDDTVFVVPPDVLLGDLAEWIGIHGTRLLTYGRAGASGGRPRAPARAPPA